MDGSIIVLFCSKYSQKSITLLNQIKDKLDFRKIYVDNNDIRNTLLDEYEKYNIRIVPTILVFFSNGIMNKYEGAKAFEWANDVCRLLQNDIQSIPKKNLYSDIPTIEELAVQKKIQNDPDGPQEVKMIESKTNDINDLSKDENNLYGMKRKMETSPLIQRNEKDLQNVPNRMDGNRNEKKILDKKNDSIKLIAQQLQAQREKEDEQLNPNALSKITTPP